jgi:hypothetical protein
MGLDFSHCDAHWAYSGFNRFRTRLCQELGVDWEAIVGKLFQKMTTEEEKQADAEFAKIADHDIAPLLNHSDCDGDLSPEQCVSVARALRSLTANWPDDDYDKQQAIFLAEGCELAAQNGEKLEFC